VPLVAAQGNAMKFLCSNCKAKYQIADEKVAGRTLRMTCRRCQEEIVIRGEPTPVGASFAPSVAPSRVPSAPSPLGEGFQMQVAAPHVRSSLPPPPPIEEWHVAINDVPVGPIRREDVARKLAAGQIDSQSLAWREGMDDWAPIAQIPELAHLSNPPPAAHLMPPPLLSHPPMRPFAMEPAWATDERSSQVVMNPSLVDQVSLRRATPSWPAMFAMACLFAFLMSGMTILGARWLREPSESTPVAAGAGGAPAVAAPQPTLELPPAAQQETEPVVIEVEDPALKNGTATGARPRSGGGPARPKKELTAEQREMLARMGGNTGSDLGSLSTSSSSGPSPGRLAGSLPAAEVSKVVMRGRKNLQRCYETAVRASPSEETIRMDVEFTVSAAGNVTNIRTTGGNLPGMAQCIERTVKMWRFPQSDENSPVKFPLLFQPGA
jgi:hypothetical protein